MNMSVDSINPYLNVRVANPLGMSRVQSMHARLASIDARIRSKDEQIARVDTRAAKVDAHIYSMEQEIALTKEQITTLQESRTLTQELLTGNESLMAVRLTQRDITQALLSSHQVQKNDIAAIINNNEALIYNHKASAVTHQEHKLLLEKLIIGTDEEQNIRRDLLTLMKESQALDTKKLTVHDQLTRAYIESNIITERQIELSERKSSILGRMIDTRRQMIDVTQKMIAIMENDVALSAVEIQRLPSIVEAKKYIIAAVTDQKLSVYPKKEHAALKEVASEVVDVTFSRISATDMEANKRLFHRLYQRVELAMEKKHEALNNISDTNSHSNVNALLRPYFVSRHLAYIDLAYLDEIIV